MKMIVGMVVLLSASACEQAGDEAHRRNPNDRDARSTYLPGGGATPGAGSGSAATMKTPIYRDADIDFSGLWKNQRNSTMNITQTKDGKVSGDYTTIVGSGNGSPLTGKLVGQAHGDQLVFYVDFVPYSTPVWSGQLLTDRSGAEILETVWLNSRNIEPGDEPNSGWEQVRTGGDSFTRQKAGVKK